MRRRPQKLNCFHGVVRSSRKTKALAERSLLSHPHLPEDLLHEILSRLPVKSLLRFRCVSKSWLALVDEDAQFARSHLNNFNNNRDETRPFVTEDIEIDDKWWEIVSYVDGLVLLSRIHLGYKKDNVLKLWNPSLKQFRQVPRAPRIDPFMRSQVLGLGYDRVAKDYKIVTLIPSKFNGLSRIGGVGIYTIGGDSWKIIPFRGKKPWGLTWRDEIYVHQNMYLEGRLYFLEALDLVAFDLINEVFSYVRISTNIDSPGLLLVDGGSALAMCDPYDIKTIWIMGREMKNWSKKSNQLLYRKKKGDRLIRSFYLEDEWRALGCDLGLYHFIIHEDRILLASTPRSIQHIYTYVESLILNESNRI